MTRHGKFNLIGMLSLPVTTMVAARVADEKGVWEPYAATYGWLFFMNAIPMLLSGLVSWWLLRKAIGGVSRTIAVTPTLIPAAIGIIWYLWRAIFPAEVAPRRRIYCGAAVSFDMGCSNFAACLAGRTNRPQNVK